MFKHFFKCQTLVPVQVAAYVTIEAAARLLGRYLPTLGSFT